MAHVCTHILHVLHWISPNLFEITTILYHIARVMSPNFLKKCQTQPISQDQWQIEKSIWNSNILIQNVSILMKSELGQFSLQVRLILAQCAMVQHKPFLYICGLSGCTKKHASRPFLCTMVQILFTLCIIIDQTPISTFCFLVDLSENHLSYIKKWYLIF